MGVDNHLPLTTQEVARRLGVPDHRVRYWIRTGILRAHLVGRIYLVEPAVLRGFKLPEHPPGMPGRKPVPLPA
jgi:excisionase family DNA binding protein